MNKLARLSEMTVIVADTGNLDEIRQSKPQDATTNPSLLLKAAQTPEGSSLLNDAISASNGSLGDCVDRFSVLVGCEILELIPGKVSTEIDASLSFDTEKMVSKANKIIDLYEKRGISKDRVLIKIASTWEGIKAAEQLEKEGVKCNLTLLFSLVQAIACAQSSVFLISPFVGRILDWHVANGGGPYDASADPGVKSVSEIFAYYKTYGYKTIVMGASFRSESQIEALAGCDYLTIAPSLLENLNADQSLLERALSSEDKSSHDKQSSISENQFRWELNQDAMATEKLAEGIRNFSADQRKLEALIAESLAV